MKAEADLLADEAKLARAEVNVAVARADLAVAESEAKRLEAWVGYLKLLAPYDGIIVARNANTWDFVLPSTGDPTAVDRAPDLSPSGQAAPIYVVDRTDIVRIFVDVPERDANYIHIGSEARVKVWAYRDEWLPASRDAHSPGPSTSRAGRCVPRSTCPIPAARSCRGCTPTARSSSSAPMSGRCPKSAITHAGGKSFIWRYDNGHAVRTEIQTGVSDGEWIEVTNRHVKSKSPGKEQWVPIEASEQVLMGSKLSTLTDGGPVRLGKSPVPTGEESKDSSSDETGGG